MKNKYVLITGSDGLVGSDAVIHFSNLGYKILGIDNNSRMKFFGQEASILWKRNYLKENIPEYIHFDQDITNKEQMEEIFSKYSTDIEIIIHAAGQPSHDWAATNPRLDFTTNAYGTLNILECFKEFCPEASFIFLSTNKVYGDNPNKLDLVEEEFRYSIKPGTEYEFGIDEKMSIDNTLHSLFGASKASADLIVQEYGKYFGLNTVSFRGGCLTGPSHSGTSLHGFLSYLIKCIVTGEKYTIFGHNGKQVRDNIHSTDLVNAFSEYHKNPKKGAVYNMGGGLESNCSMLEAIMIGEEVSGKKLNYNYIKDARVGDHVWYISDLSKFKNDYPQWKISYNIERIIKEIYNDNLSRFK